MNITKSEKYFLELLKVSVGNATELITCPTEREWEEIFIIAKKHAMSGIVSEALDIIPDFQRPNRQLLFKWLCVTLEIEKINRHQNIRINQLIHFFGQKHIACAILKGQSVALYYPNPLRRIPGDIDIWLEGDRKYIMSCLHDLNVKLGEIVYHHVDADIFEDTDVEVHFRPSWLWNPFRNIKLQKWFKLESNKQMNHSYYLPDGSEIKCPTRDFNAVYLLMHIYRHVFDEGIGIRQLADYYYCIIKDGNNDIVKHNIEMFGLLNFAGAIMFVLHIVFGLSPGFYIVQPDMRRGAFLLDEIMKAGNFGRFDTRVSQNYKKRTFSNLYRKLKHNARFFLMYPGELFWELPFKIWHYIWRLSVNNR